MLSFILLLMLNLSAWIVADISFLSHKHAQDSTRAFIKFIASGSCELHKQLISRDSLVITVCAAPVYALAYGVDRKLAEYFYDRTTHTNIRQLPPWCEPLATYGIAAPLGLTFGCACFSPDLRVQATAQALWFGMPSIWVTKRLIKAIHGPWSERPANQYFDRDRIYYEAFPSGHLIVMSYITTLCALRHGWQAALPSGIFGAYVAAEYIICNRHYLSQLVAGAAIGVAYACAASKLAERLENIIEPVTLAVTPDVRGVSCVYNF